MLHLVESEEIWGLQWGLPKWSSSPLKHSEDGVGAIGSGWDLCRAGSASEVHHPFLSVLALMTKCRSLYQRTSSFSPGMRTLLCCPLSGVVALSEPDSEMMSMLSRAAENFGLMWNPPPRPDPSRFDEWFLGGGRASSQHPPPVTFFPEVHEELTRSWKAPFTARIKSLWLLPPHHALMVEPLWGT